MFVAVDLGNSRCKVCLVLPEGAPEPVCDLPCDRDVIARLAAALAGVPRPEAAALASVADDRLQSAVRAAVRVAFGVEVPVNPDSGLELRVESPGTVGPDRLYAARGALDLAAGRGWSPARAVVVDAGTALTVDAAIEDGGGVGAFLGGAIAPGPALLARALAHGAARLPVVEPEPECPALGRDTRSAIAAGVCVGFEGAALRLVERIALEAGLEDAPVVLTGGARAYLTRVLERPGRVLLVEPSLVHLGLAAACGGRRR